MWESGWRCFLCTCIVKTDRNFMQITALLVIDFSTVAFCLLKATILSQIFSFSWSSVADFWIILPSLSQLYTGPQEGAAGLESALDVTWGTDSNILTLKFLVEALGSIIWPLLPLPMVTEVTFPHLRCLLRKWCHIPRFLASFLRSFNSPSPASPQCFLEYGSFGTRIGHNSVKS